MIHIVIFFIFFGILKFRFGYLLITLLMLDGKKLFGLFNWLFILLISNFINYFFTRWLLRVAFFVTNYKFRLLFLIQRKFKNRWGYWCLFISMIVSKLLFNTFINRVNTLSMSDFFHLINISWTFNIRFIQFFQSLIWFVPFKFTLEYFMGVLFDIDYNNLLNLWVRSSLLVPVNRPKNALRSQVFGEPENTRTDGRYRHWAELILIAIEKQHSDAQLERLDALRTLITVPHRTHSVSNLLELGKIVSICKDDISIPEWLLFSNDVAKVLELLACCPYDNAGYTTGMFQTIICGVCYDFNFLIQDWPFDKLHFDAAFKCHTITLDFKGLGQHIIITYWRLRQIAFTFVIILIAAIVGIVVIGVAVIFSTGLSTHILYRTIPNSFYST